MALEFPIKIIEFVINRLTIRKKTLWFCFYEALGWYASKVQNKTNSFFFENDEASQDTRFSEKQHKTQIEGLKDMTC